MNRLTKPTLHLSKGALVAALVAALALGSFGSASAAGLTKAMVTKIATTVVKKQAKHLSVAKAKNSTLLAGKPATAYQDNSTTYSVEIPQASPVSSFVYTVPVTAGRSYQLSYDVVLEGTTAGTSFCTFYLVVGGSPTLVVGASEFSGDTEVAHSGTGSVTVPAGDQVVFDCQGAGSFYTSDIAPSSVTVTPLDSLVDGGPLAVFSRSLPRHGLVH